MFDDFARELKILSVRRTNLYNQISQIDNQLKSIYSEMSKRRIASQEATLKHLAHFVRTEDKFECTYQTADVLTESLEPILKPELFFNNLKQTNIFNVWFENAEKLPNIKTDNYSRVRLQKYHSNEELIGNDPFFWVELRKVDGLEVSKKRFCLLANYLPQFFHNSDIKYLINSEYPESIELRRALDSYEDIISWMKKTNAKPFVAVDYTRKAFNSRDRSTRVTIDSNIKYYSVPENIDTEKFELKNFELLGEEDVAIVKFKHTKPLPAEIESLKERLSPPRSKIRRALSFLKEKGL